MIKSEVTLQKTSRYLLSLSNNNIVDQRKQWLQSLFRCANFYVGQVYSIALFFTVVHILYVQHRLRLFLERKFLNFFQRLRHNLRFYFGLLHDRRRR